MTILVTGGGSGGHITPILAVAHELKILRPDVRIVYVGQRGDALADVPARHPAIDEVQTVSAGKLRRYHSEGLKQLLNIKTMLLNIRDVYRVLAGIVQSYRLLQRVKPDIIFIKGGFVGVPVGLAAAKLGIPFITHDSDAIPGLANRIIARWARKHAVALPAEVYAYDQQKTVTVGVPVTHLFTPVTAASQQQYKQEIGLAADTQLLFIIGGGLGAQRINDAMLQGVRQLLTSHPQLHIVHGVGRANEATMTAAYGALLTPAELSRVEAVGFMHDVYRYSGAADVIVTRAGATNLAEFAMQGKACIVVPNPYLTAGHQLKNAAYLAEQQATEQLTEDDLQTNPACLADKVDSLLRDPARRMVLGQRFTAFAHPAAARELAELLLDEV